MTPSEVRRSLSSGKILIFEHIGIDLSSRVQYLACLGKLQGGGVGVLSGVSLSILDGANDGKFLNDLCPAGGRCHFFGDSEHDSES